jgi:hypothetical protein
MFLKKEVVSGSYMIVFIRFETLPSVFNVDIVLCEVLQNLRVNRDLIDTHYRPSEVFLTFHEVKPGVLSYIVYFIAFIRIRIENASYQVFCFV